MSKTMYLTDSEAAVIEEMRAKVEEEQAMRKTALEILRTAYEYEKWLQAEGVGSTYSTFCDDFGYGADSKIFDRVQKTRKAAYGE